MAAFSSPAAFATFIAEGVSSYGLSRYPGRLTKVDLRKADQTYDPIRVDELDGPVLRQWKACGGVLDSGFRTAGGRYEWTYHGVTDREPFARPVDLTPATVAATR